MAGPRRHTHGTGTVLSAVGLFPPANLRHGGLVLLLLLLSGCVSYHPLPLRASLPVQTHADAQIAAALQRAHLPRQERLSINPSRPLSGESLGLIAVLLNPDLRAMRAQEGVAQAQVFAAGLLPDPQLSLSADLPSNVTAGYYNAYNMALNWSLAALFTRPADLDIARAQARSVQYQVAWQEWMVANQVRILTRQLYYLEQQEDLARRAALTTQRLYRASQENLQAGDATITTATLRQIAWLDSQDRALALARQITKARQDLNKLLGLPPEAKLALLPPRLGATPTDPSALVAKADHQRLDLLALRAGYAAQEARVRRSILGQYPGFSIGLTKAADTSNIHTLGPSVSLDLPLWNRNRGAIAVAEATRGQLHAEYSARLFQTRAEIYTLVADLQRLAAEIAPLAREVPQLQRAEERLRRAASERNVTLIDYESVRSQSLAKGLQLLALQQAYAEQQAALTMAIGGTWKGQP